MMDCRQLQDLLPLHAINELRVEESLAVEEHLDGCDACGKELATYRRICETASRELGDVPGIPAGAPGRRLRAGAERGASSPAPGRLFPGQGRWVPALALAATFLMAGVLVGRWSAAPVDQPAPVPAGSLSDRLTLAPLRRVLKDEISTAAYRRPTLSVFSRTARSILTQAVQSGDAGEGDDGAGRVVRPPERAVPGVDG